VTTVGADSSAISWKPGYDKDDGSLGFGRDHLDNSLTHLAAAAGS
jgi:hypothetical protein